MDMPPHKPKLSEAEIKALEEWIRAGAVMPVPADTLRRLTHGHAIIVDRGCKPSLQAAIYWSGEQDFLP